MMRVTVLRGGPSAEREISLVSGAAVAKGLREAGHDVWEGDVSPTDLSALSQPCDVVFPVLHGAFGEDGQLQAILESRGLKFVGSDARSSAIAIDKLATKRRWIEHGLATPAFHVADRNDPTLGRVGAPCVVKSLRSGSSIGVHVCKTHDEAEARLRETLDADGIALVEQFVAGTEVTVGILDRTALPPIRIVYEDGFFDFKNKYGANGAKHDFDTGLSIEQTLAIQQDVQKAHDAVGCRDLSRTDVMVDATTGKHYLIEINTMPGFTPRSLLPEAAGKVGLSFPALVDKLVNMALSR